MHPCRLGAQDLEATYRKYQVRGIVFLGVDIQQDDWDNARDFLEKFGITYPAIRDVNGESAQKFQLVGLPTTYFVDKNGLVRSKFVGVLLGAGRSKGVRAPHPNDFALVSKARDVFAGMTRQKSDGRWHLG